MPPRTIYEVDFSGGNLAPALDVRGWGAMQLGDSGAVNNPASFSDNRGLNLSVYRPPGATTHAAIGVSVVAGPNVIPLATRLLLKVEFDNPNAQLLYVQQPSNVVAPSPPPGSPTPEPWAVALNVRFGNAAQVHNEPLVAVTTQFNRQFNGARLNTPSNEQGDQTPVLLTPLDYTVNPQYVYEMEHNFCGINAVGGRAIGSGALFIGPPGTLRDQRVYSNVGLSSGQTWIGALGVALVTLSGTGQIMVRLRKFSVSAWS